MKYKATCRFIEIKNTLLTIRILILTLRMKWSSTECNSRLLCLKINIPILSYRQMSKIKKVYLSFILK